MITIVAGHKENNFFLKILRKLFCEGLLKEKVIPKSV